MKRLFFPVLLAATIAQSAYAYNVEIGAGVSSLSEEYDYDLPKKTEIDTDKRALLATVYFKEVDSGDAPYAEAAFLSKAGSVSLGFSKADMDYEYKEPGFTAKNSNEFDDLSLALHAVFNDFILEIQVNDEDEESDRADIEGTYRSFGMGGYLSDNSTIIVSLLKYKRELDSDSYAGSYTMAEHSGINAALKFFIPLNNARSLSVGGDISILDSELSDGYVDGAMVSLNIFADFYLSKNLALNFALDTASFAGESDNNFSNDTDITEVVQFASFGAEYFINRHFAVFGGLTLGSGEYDEDGYYDDGDYDYSATGGVVGIKGRF
jgi:hypothetical protein